MAELGLEPRLDGCGNDKAGGAGTNPEVTFKVSAVQGREAPRKWLSRVALPSHPLVWDTASCWQGPVSRLLESGSVSLQLLSSLDPLENSTSLCLGVMLGG